MPDMQCCSNAREKVGILARIFGIFLALNENPTKLSSCENRSQRNILVFFYATKNQVKVVSHVNCFVPTPSTLPLLFPIM
jgi:hypothetical protein